VCPVVGSSATARSKTFSVAAEKQQGESLPPRLEGKLARFSRELRILVTLTFAATAGALASDEASLWARAGLSALVWARRSELELESKATPTELQLPPQSQLASLSPSQ
jgi:hypothetical protein